MYVCFDAESLRGEVLSGVCGCVCVQLFFFLTTQVDQEHILIYSNGREGEESGQECVCGGSYLCMVTLTSVLSL